MLFFAELIFVRKKHQLFISENELTIPDSLENVAWHESNHFGGKK